VTSLSFLQRQETTKVLMKKNYTLKQLPQIAQLIIEESSKKTLLFYGSMGVGKTTLIKEIVKQLVVVDVVSHLLFHWLMSINPTMEKHYIILTFIAFIVKKKL